MKKFLIHIILIIGIPFLIIFSLYWITDPFKINHPFSLDHISTVNREYLSMELFIKQYPHYKYNSFIFGSSRGGGINSYHWKQLLDKSHTQKDTISQFLFQAWSESITGIYQKINYLDKNQIPINNALVLIDISMFCKTQDHKSAMDVKHYMLSGHSKFNYQWVFIQAYMEKPDKVISSIVELWKHPDNNINFDTISNDWDKEDQYQTEKEPDKNYTLDKSRFKDHVSEEQFSPKEITSGYIPILNDIKQIFDYNKTYYKIIITPDYNQVHMNMEDLEILEKIFGKENVYNFSGKNYITDDKFNFSDPNHFDLITGWQMLNEIYK